MDCKLPDNMHQGLKKIKSELIIKKKSIMAIEK
jgi:hypothetical protein